jgi:hypothetical protein
MTSIMVNASALRSPEGQLSGNYLFPGFQLHWLIPQKNPRQLVVG